MNDFDFLCAFVLLVMGRMPECRGRMDAYERRVKDFE